MSTKVDKERTLKKVVKLYSFFQQGKIPTLANHEVHPGLNRRSRENYLYFTLPPCINFQRSSPAMWAAAFETYEDPETNYLFFPEEVVKQNRQKVQKDLLKHKLALQQNKHTEIWITISSTLHRLFKDDPRVLFKQGCWDVVKIRNILQKEQRVHFPYLSGPKMANYWLYIISRYTEAKFLKMDEISIIPDTHIQQASVKLGLTKISDSPLKVAEVWQELLKGGEIQPVQMHPVLWNWSRNDFQPEV